MRIFTFSFSKMSKDPEKWLSWYKELEEEEVLGVADPDEDDGDFCSNSIHDTDSEEDAEEQDSADENIGWHENNDVPRYVGKDRVTRWSKICPPNTRTKAYNIFEKRPGPIDNAANAKTILECFEIFISNNIVEMVTNFTNIYIEKVKSNYNRERDARQTDQCEMRALFGMLYLLGVSKSGRQNITDFWRTDGTGMDAIYCTMSYNRFRFLLRCLRFDDVNTRQERRETDKLAAIRNIFEIFIGNCQKSVIPGPDLTLDEQLVSFRGRCPFRQYIPSKPAKYGIKVFALVDSSNMYTLNLEIYAGTQPEGPFQLSNSPSDVVKRLVSFIRGTYRNITMDNWFSSFPLAIELKNEFKLTMLGTVKKNKREIPIEFINTTARPDLSSQFAFHKDCTLVSFVPRKKKNVLVLSTSHTDDSIDQDTGKPTMIVDYNHSKFGVDVVDQMCGSYNVARNSRRWPLTIFFDIMNIAGINALLLFQMNNSDLTVVRRDFLRSLALNLMKPQIKKRFCTPNVSKQLREKCRFLLENEDHSAEASTSAETIASQPKRVKTGNGRCYICPRKRDKRTRNYCSLCNNWICKEHQKDMPVICLKCEEKEDD